MRPGHECRRALQHGHSCRPPGTLHVDSEMPAHQVWVLLMIYICTIMYDFSDENIVNVEVKAQEALQHEAERHSCSSVAMIGPKENADSV